MLGTTAMYSCDTGYGLNGGDLERECVGNSTESFLGYWTGDPPLCTGNQSLYNCIQLIIIPIISV